MELAKNLLGCFLGGVVIFGLAVFRGIEIEDQPFGAAAITGLVAGGGIAVALSTVVLVLSRRERHSRKPTDR